MAAEISGLKVTVRVECPRCSAKYEATFVPPPARIVPPAVAVRGLWSPLAPSHRDPSGAGGRGVIVLARATDRERAALDLAARGGRGAEGPPRGRLAMTPWCHVMGGQGGGAWARHARQVVHHRDRSGDIGKETE